jgi:ABC-type nickel/cobalt efflux system permease component RcnA
VPAWSQNPFTSKPKTVQKAPEAPFRSPLFADIILWQQQLKQKMADLIRFARQDGNIKPLLLLMGLAFAYGALHAAGPGHGKFVAVSYILSHNSSVISGLLLGLFTAFLHGFSGAMGVLGLRYIIHRSVSETLATVTTTTQIASFGLVALLGLGILLKSGYELFFAPPPKSAPRPAETSPKGLLPWAMAVGLVPCPAVVMVMLFCLSMNAMVLGLVLAACISLGMATTLSLVITSVVLGKTSVFNVVPQKYAHTINGMVGILSGTAISLFGTLFLLTTIHAAVF